MTKKLHSSQKSTFVFRKTPKPTLQRQNSIEKQIFFPKTEHFITSYENRENKNEITIKCDNLISNYNDLGTSEKVFLIAINKL